MSSDEAFDRQQAREHLASARATESISRPAIPGWAIGINAVLLPILILSQLTSDPQSTYGVGIAVIALNLIVGVFSGVLRFDRSPTSSTSTASPRVFSAVGSIVVLVIGSFIAYQTTGASWVAIAGAVLTGLAVIAAGLAFARSRALRR